MPKCAAGLIAECIGDLGQTEMTIENRMESIRIDGTDHIHLLLPVAVDQALQANVFEHQ
ncbi:hypothetical protein [Actimicrobium antarcticum]|uniref:Uncharacterized protein n=1 Tax=Actimicrobium antarcticum TaxID=1051899 RepID=A0ABP7TPE7_9BURK